MWINLARRFIAVGILAMTCSIATADAATLALVSSAPADNSVEVARVDALNLQFSTAISPYSVRADTIKLASDAGIQKVSLSVSGANIVVKPLTPLLPWTTYTLNAQSLVGAAGEQLAQPVAIVFKTRDAVWQPPLLVDRMTSGQWNQVTAVNNKGVRFVAWLQSNGVGDDVWAIRHVTGETSPGTPALVASLSNDFVGQLQVFVDDNGNAFVTWRVDRENPLLPHHMWANRFVAGSGWGSGWGKPQAIDYDPHAERQLSSTNLHLVFDHGGNALVIWQAWDCCGSHSLQRIVASRYTQRSGWSTPIHLDDSSAFLAGDTALQIDDQGNAYAAWSMVADIHYPTADLKVSRYAINSGWSAPQTIVSESDYDNGGHALTVNPRGEAFLMWAYDGGLEYAHADELGRWGTPIGIDSTVHAPPSSMVFIDSGIAFAAFINGVKMFRPDKGWWDWMHPLLPQQNASSAPRIVADKSGNALVAWTQTSGGIDRIFAKRYRAGRGWFNSAPIDTGNTLGAGLEELFLDSNGSALAAWGQGNELGTGDLKVANFK